MSEFTGTIKTVSVTTITILGIDIDIKTPDLIKSWIQVTNSSGEKNIRKIKKSTETIGETPIITKTVKLEIDNLLFTPKEGDYFIIIKTPAPFIYSGIIDDGTTDLNIKDSKVSEYTDYYIHLLKTDEVRKIISYDTRTLTLDHKLLSIPVKGDKYNIISDFMQEYTLYGIDLSDMSNILDIFGGKLYFEMSSLIFICSSCFLIIIISVMMVYTKITRRGGGGGGYGSGGGGGQPIIIQMPMQTAQYPFPSSPFPRST